MSLTTARVTRVLTICLAMRAAALVPSALAQNVPAPKPTPQLPASEVPIAITEPKIDTVDRVVAVVGGGAITYSDLSAKIFQERAQGLPWPPDSAGQMREVRRILNDLVDEEILVQKAHELKIEVSDQDVATSVDMRLKQIRAQFPSDSAYRLELRNAGFGTPEEYRRSLFDQIRRAQLQQRAFSQLVKKARPGNVTEGEVDTAFAQARDELQRRPAMITFRQIVIAPRPSAAADARAKTRAESLLVELKKGADFEAMAKRESADPGSAKLGGDLGWNRRGSGFVPEFEQAMFRLQPGELSPVVKTSFGYHIIRVDRVQPAEVKVRHILIAPVIDSSDIRLAAIRADSVARALRSGTNFDSLVAKYHDPAEEKAVLQPIPVDTLPSSYRVALAGLKANQVADPFPLNGQNGSVKYAVVQVVSRTAPGEYSLNEVRDTIREQLASERRARTLLDNLHKETYVSLRL